MLEVGLSTETENNYTFFLFYFIDLNRLSTLNLHVVYKLSQTVTTPTYFRRKEVKFDTGPINPTQTPIILDVSVAL